MDRKNNRAYTLIETLIVVAIMAVLAVIAAYGLKNQDQSQVVINAQRDFVTNLRSVQNNVRNGVDGQAVMSVILTQNSSSYTIVSATSPLKTKTILLPTGVTVGFAGSATQAVCFANVNLSAYTSAAKCASAPDGTTACVSGTGYLCTSTTASSPTNLTVNFTNNTVTKTVSIEGAGMNIVRVYATN